MFQKLSLVFSLLLCHSVIAQRETTVYFDFDKYSLTSTTVNTLDSLVSTGSNINSFEIYGHCDQLGSKEYNYRLSEKRAEEVKAYLRSKGVAEAKITLLKGFGKDMPIVDRLDDASRQLNRRVTIVSIFIHPPSTAVVTQPPNEKLERQPEPPPKPVRKEKLIDEITDTATKTGQNIVLRNINFYPGSHRFLPFAYGPLQELLEAMEQVPTLVIEIQGHICCRDDQGDGWDYDTGEPFLSYNRARAVWEFLVRRGIARSRMTYKGYGHKFPIYAQEENEEERTANRRVELKIVAK